MTLTKLLSQAYSVSPVALQNLGVSAYGLVWKNRRFGGQFQGAVRGFISREKYNSRQWYQYQTEQLRTLLSWSNEVPYYDRAFRKLGINSAELSRLRLEDLSQLPRLEKETLRADPNQLVSKKNKGRLHTFQTSGTTGSPLVIKLTSAVHQLFSAAYEARCRRWAGVSHKMSRTMIGGRIVVPRAESKPPFWRYNLAERQLYMSAFHLSPQNVVDYVEALNRFRPHYLVGYASSYFFLARMIRELDLKVHQPSSVLTSSEILSPEMRDTIESVFRCEVFDGYSGVESCCLASECEHHRMHVSLDVGVVEILDEDGKPVCPGTPGEIVATGFLNSAQPLIRYRTGDLATWSNEGCPCGRQMPVLQEICGRREDAIILRDGRTSASFYKVFQGVIGILEAQVIQEDYDDFTLHLVSDSSFTPNERDALLNNIKVRYGSVQIHLRFVDHIDRTSGGKLRLVISKVRSELSDS